MIAKPAARRGFTLVEVVAGMALLAVLLVGIVKATSQHRRNMARAAERIEAAALVDELAERLRTRQGTFPIGQVGPLPKRPGWEYRVALTSSQQVLGVPVQTVAIQIVDAATQRVIVQVDVLQKRGP